MNDGPAETGRLGEPGGAVPPPPRDDSPVANALHPTPGDEWSTPDTMLNGHAVMPDSFAPEPEAEYAPVATPPAIATRPARNPFGDFWGGIQGWFQPRSDLRDADLRRNLPIGVAIAALNGFADALLLPSVVIAAFVARVSDSNKLVALIPVVAALAWALPGAVAGSAIANRAQSVALAMASAALRAAAMGLLAFVCAGRVNGSAKRLLVTFFRPVWARWLREWVRGARRSAPADTDRHQWRAGEARSLAGAGTGRSRQCSRRCLVRRVLVHGPAFPREYLYLFFIAFIALIGVAILTVGLTERGSRVPLVPRPPLGGLRAAPSLLRLPGYRRYLIFRIIALAATLAEPFYVVYALRTFAVSADMVGIYAIAVIATRAVTTYLWRGLARLAGTKLLLQLGALCRALAAVIAIALPVLYETDPIASHFTSDLTRARVFIAVFVCIGAAMGANAIAQSGLLLDILPRTPTRMGSRSRMGCSPCAASLSSRAVSSWIATASAPSSSPRSPSACSPCSSAASCASRAARSAAPAPSAPASAAPKPSPSSPVPPTPSPPSPPTAANGNLNHEDTKSTKKREERKRTNE